MRLTKEKLMQIIKEELDAVMETLDDEKAIANKMLARMRAEPMDDAPTEDDAEFIEDDHDNDIFDAANTFTNLDEFIEDIAIMTGFTLSRGRAKQVYDWANERIGPLSGGQ